MSRNGDVGIWRRAFQKPDLSLLNSRLERDPLVVKLSCAFVGVKSSQMPFSRGDHLGPYEVSDLLGKGGMGEVYLAHDSRLGRNVAVKVSAAQFSERFEREARAAAQLNHPNVCTIHDVGPNFIVMEFVDGETLAARIKQGPIPLDEALRFAHQIIDGMEAAHEKGITHRDLKPANIKIKPDGSIKVLDFGLAKVAPASAGGVQPSENSPTLTMGMTEAGMILGTAAYMAPEQAKGKQDVDKRADIWAFAVILHEMLTTERLFQGEDIGETLASVIKERPDFTRAPQRIHRLLGRCLEKDPRKRLRDIGDARMLLEDVGQASTPAVGLQTRQSAVSSMAAAIALLLAAALGFGWWRAARPIDHPLIRLSADLGPDAVAATNLTVAISPDGAHIAFLIRGTGGRTMLATRLLDQTTPTMLAGTEDASMPFFSPDGKWIGFLAEGKLKKISVLGGAALTVADSIRSERGASWGDDGNIVYVRENAGGLWRVSESGGTPQAITKPVERGEATHRWPQVLPKARAVLFTAKAPDIGANLGPGYDDANIEVLSFKNGQIKNLIRGGYYPRYVPNNGATGHLVYVHQGVLFGVPFDPERLEVRGSPTPLLEDVAASALAGGGQFDVSGTLAGTGTLVYLAGKGVTGLWPVTWLDSSGNAQPLLKPGIYNAPRVSPDGNWLALSVFSSGGRDLYVYDWRHDTMPRLTFNNQQSNDPVWAPDGKHIAYDTPDGIYWVRSDGAGQPQPLLQMKAALAQSFSPDGKRLAYAAANSNAGSFSLWTLPLDTSDPEHPKPGKPEQFLADGYSGEFSPDGRWIAYTSLESGQNEVYVRPFPGPGGKWQISTGNGRYPVWSRNGREIFFANADDRIMVSEYSAKGESFSYNKPRVWSEKQLYYVGGRRYFDLSPDGKRFAVIPRPGSEEKQGNLHVTFLLNFADELRRRIPLN